MTNISIVRRHLLVHKSNGSRRVFAATPLSRNVLESTMQKLLFNKPNRVKNRLVRLRLKSGIPVTPILPAQPIEIKPANLPSLPATRHQVNQPAPVPDLKPVKLLKPTNKVEQDNYDFEMLQRRLTKRFKDKGLNTPIVVSPAPTKQKGGIMDNIGKIFDCNKSVITKSRGNGIIETI